MYLKRQVLFVQGGGAGVHERWDSKLVDSLRRELGQEPRKHVANKLTSNRLLKFVRNRAEGFLLLDIRSFNEVVASL
jgi:hypothetical protein